MADEIHADYESGNTLYAVIRNKAGQVWHIMGKSFESWGANGHSASDYDIALVDKGGSKYVGSLDSNLPAGTYWVQTFLQVGTIPSDDDSVICSKEIVWTGTGELTCKKMLANKAVQDKVTGAISYYDDDGQTVILILAADDSGASLMRVPE
jgi:hypothetical protein